MSCKECPNQSFKVETVTAGGKKIMSCVSCGARHIEAGKIEIDGQKITKRDIYENQSENEREILQILVEPEKEITVVPTPNPMGKTDKYSFEEFAEEFL